MSSKTSSLRTRTMTIFPPLAYAAWRAEVTQSSCSTNCAKIDPADSKGKYLHQKCIAAISTSKDEQVRKKLFGILKQSTTKRISSRRFRQLTVLRIRSLQTRQKASSPNCRRTPKMAETYCKSLANVFRTTRKRSIDPSCQPGAEIALKRCAASCGTTILFPERFSPAAG